MPKKSKKSSKEDGLAYTNEMKGDGQGDITLEETKQYILKQFDMLCAGLSKPGCQMKGD